MPFDGVMQPVLTVGASDPIKKGAVALYQPMMAQIFSSTIHAMNFANFSEERMTEICNHAVEIQELELTAAIDIFSLLKKDESQTRSRLRRATSSDYSRVLELMGVGELADKTLIYADYDEQREALDKIVDMLLAGTDESIAKMRDYMIYHVMGHDYYFIPSASKGISSNIRLSIAFNYIKYYRYRMLTEAYGKEKINKATCQAMMEEFRSILIERIGQLDWMSDATKQAAQKKAREQLYFIGYPDQWNEEFTPAIQGNTLLEVVSNMRRQSANFSHKMVGRNMKTNGWDF